MTTNSLTPQKQNTLAKKSDTRFSSFIANPKIKAMIQNTLKDGKSFITAITSAVGANPKLQECTNESIFSAALLGASLNLPPSPQLGYFYLVPFKDKKAGLIKAQFQLGYKGYIQLALRTGQYKRLNVLEIKEGEFINWNPLTEDFQFKCIADEEEREKAPTVGYYVMFELINGFTKQLFWTRKKMELYADTYSQAFDLNIYKQLQAGTYKGELWKLSSYWYKEFDDMAKKTMLKQIISKFGPMSTEMAKAFENDEASINIDGSAEIIEVEPVPAQEEPKAPEQVETESPEPAPEEDPFN